jgi:hypothetical protein
MATELSVIQWWKTPNLKEDEEIRKSYVDQNDSLWAALPGQWRLNLQVSKYPSFFRLRDSSRKPIQKRGLTYDPEAGGGAVLEEAGARAEHTPLGGQLVHVDDLAAPARRLLAPPPPRVAHDVTELVQEVGTVLPAGPI